MGDDWLEESEKTIVIEITRSEAIVLEALPTRWDTEDMPSTLRLEYPAEWSALWAVEAGLESQLVDLFGPDYSNHLDEARENVSMRAASRVGSRPGGATRVRDLGQLLGGIARKLRGR